MGQTTDTVKKDIPGLDIASQIGEGVGAIMEMFGQGEMNDLQESLNEYRTNPADVLKKIDQLEILTDVGSQLAGGKPIAAAGTAVGHLLTGKQRKAERAEATADWSKFWGSRSAQNITEAGFKKGGKIKGKGTAKSDSINMNAPEGSFIVPVENASQAMQYGKEYLGWDDSEVAKRNYGNVDIGVSNGEVFFTPDEYDALKYYEVNPDGLAPDAEKNNTGFCRGGRTRKAEGGEVKKSYPSAEKAQKILDDGKINGKPLTEDQEKFFRALANGWTPDNYQDGGPVTFDEAKQISDERTQRSVYDPMNEYISNLEAGIQKDIGSESFPDVAKIPIPDDQEKTFMDKIMSNFGEVAGATQAMGGAAGLAAAGRKPDINVSKTLESLSRQTRADAGYGLAPSVKNEMEKKSARDFRAATNVITGRGGSAQEINSKIVAALSTKLSSNLETELADYQARERKKDRAISVGMVKAGQEFDITKMTREDWYKTQETFANLLSAGVENIIGARQYKQEVDLMKKIRGTGSTFTFA